MTIQQILEEALKLSEEERVQIAVLLINSLETESENDTRVAWELEIRKRLREIETGAVAMIPWTTVRSELSKSE